MVEGFRTRWDFESTTKVNCLKFARKVECSKVPPALPWRRAMYSEDVSPSLRRPILAPLLDLPTP